jgi:hypothetical protein
MKYWISRSLRVGAFALATGIAFMGAGNVFGISAIQSAAFGAVGAVLGLLATLLFTYAGKASVPAARQCAELGAVPDLGERGR